MTLLRIFLLITILLSTLECEAVEINISAIIQIESSGNPSAYNKASGCIGLMGINPNGAMADYNQYVYEICRNDNDLARWDRLRVNEGSLFDPERNVAVGTWYITKKIPQYLSNFNIPDTLDNRLIAYNWGIGRLKDWYRSGADYSQLPRETKNYIKKYNKFNAQ